MPRHVAGHDTVDVMREKKILHVCFTDTSGSRVTRIHPLGLSTSCVNSLSLPGTNAVSMENSNSNNLLKINAEDDSPSVICKKL